MEIIKLNLIPSGVNPICHAKQYDEGRIIRFMLFDGLTPYTLQSGDTVTLNLRKPDNTIIDTSVTATQGNKHVDLVTTEQICAVAGYNLGTFKITNGSVDIGTLNFIMEVGKDVLANGIPSQSVIEDLDALVAEAVGDNYYPKSETYNKTEVDNKLALKANTNELIALETKVINAIGKQQQLYNKDNTTRYYYYDSNGDIVENASGTWRITNEMSVVGFDFITYSGLVTVGTTPCSFWRLQDDSKIVFKQKVGTNSIEIPENAVAIAFSVQQNDYEAFSVVGVKKSTIVPNNQFKTSLFIGENAGDNNQEPFDYIESQTNEGCFNTAVGVKAMANNETGDHCTAVGFQAMETNVSGDANTAIGEDALFANVSGSGNTAVGAHVLQNSKSSGNVAVGQSALQSQTTGYFNTAVGNETGKGSGVAITTDDRLTLIGNKAGKSVNDILTNSTAIGSGAMVSKSNQVVLGNASVTELIFGNKKIIFNNDGSVTWETVT